MNLVKDALLIFEAALTGVRPDVLMRQAQVKHLFHDAGARFERICVVGAGKASMVMASALEGLLGNHINDGLVVVPHGYVSSYPAVLPYPTQIEVVEAGHPVPDRAGFEASVRVLDRATSCTERDLVIALISGGGSALWPAVVEGVPFADARETYMQLLHCGATIHEVNTVRKHLSRLGGGRLAAATKATVYALVLSDVVGDDLSTIASGPCSPDPTTFADVRSILHQYALWPSLPPLVRAYIEHGLKHEEDETPAPSNPVFDRVHTLLLGGNGHALAAASKAAKDLGYTPQVVQHDLIGEARIAGPQLIHHVLSQPASDLPRCFLWGGETTVTVTGRGKGGRNQELVLGALSVFPEKGQPLLLLSGGTDGIDGPTDAAGAWVTPDTRTRAQTLGLDASIYLAENNAYPFFDALKQLLKPGPTHTNVMDLQILLTAL